MVHFGNFSIKFRSHNDLDSALIEDMELHISDPKYDFHGAYGFLSVSVCNGEINQINS